MRASLLVFIFLSLATEFARADVYSLESRSLPEGQVDLASCKEVGNAGSSPLGKWYWEEQDTIEQEILDAMGSISLKTDVIHKYLDNGKYDYHIGFDFSPKRKVYPVNFGSVVDGKPITNPLWPNQSPKSGYLIVDSFKTALYAPFSTTQLLQDVSNFFHYASVGLGIEVGLEVKKISLRRSSIEVASLLQQSDKQQMDSIQELNASSDKSNNGAFTAVENGFTWLFKELFSVISLAYEGVEKLVQTTAKPYTADEKGKIFFQGLFDGVRLQKDLFFTNSERVKAKLIKGDTLSLLQYLTVGPGIGASMGVVRGNLSLRQRYITREVRITRLDGDKFRVRLIWYDGLGDKLEGSVGVGLGGIKLAWGRASWADFFQHELSYVFDLSPTNKKAAEAFDDFCKQIFPSNDKAETYADDPTSGVSRDALNIIGDVKKVEGKKDKYTRTAKTREASTSIEIIALNRRAKGLNNAYKRCEQSFNPVGKPQDMTCHYYTQNQKILTRNIRVLAKRHDATKVDCEAAGTLAPNGDVMRDGPGSGVSLHCYFRSADALPTNDNYRYNLDNIKAIMGIHEPQMYSVYRDPRWAPAYEKIEQVLGDIERRQLTEKRQALSVDLFMDDIFTQSILQGPDVEGRVKSTIAQILVGRGHTWAEIQGYKDYDRHCTLNTLYADLITSGAVPGMHSCADIKYRAKDIWTHFVKFQKGSAIDRLNLFNDFYGSNDRSSVVPLLFLLLGTGQEDQIGKGHLALRFSYEAVDEVDAPMKTYEIGTNIPQLASEVYIPVDRPENIQASSPPRIFKVDVCVQPDTLAAGDPTVYLTFFSELEKTKADKTFQLSGFLYEKGSALYIPPKLSATFTVPQLVPNMVVMPDGTKQFKYIVELKKLKEAGLKLDTNYLGMFNLEDPQILYEHGEPEHFSELVKLYLNMRSPEKTQRRRH